MNIIRRTNPKTGETEYRARYFWRDADDNKKDSKTGWFKTEEEAIADAENKIIQKELDAKNVDRERTDQTIPYVMDAWIEELRQQAERETTENTTTEKTRYNRARTVRKKYIPKDVEKVRIKNINENTFRFWLRDINALGLSGITVRNYKTVLIAFNQYLGNNRYYKDPDLDRRIDITLSRTPIKPKHAGERKNRRVPTIQDIDKIVSYYQALDVSKFKNFYWFSLWNVLFYSGFRVSELIGLQWKFVDLLRDTIDVRNSISEREIKSNVINRVSQGIYHTKNERSERIIPIFAIYNTLLADYKTAYKYHFNLTEEQMQDLFVFPLVLKTKEDVHDYQKQKNILRELDRVCKIQGIDKTDVQMLRHGCATWMVSDKEDGGLGFTESQAKDYFGHTGDDMLREVYAKLNKKQTARRTITTFSSLMEDKPREELKEIKSQRQLTELVLHPELNEEEKALARQTRIAGEIRVLKRYEFDDRSFADVMQVCINEVVKGNKLDGVELIWLHDGEKIRVNEWFVAIGEKTNRQEWQEIEKKAS